MLAASMYISVAIDPPYDQVWSAPAGRPGDGWRLAPQILARRDGMLWRDCTKMEGRGPSAWSCRPRTAAAGGRPQGRP
jgi:hypothetical protein